MGKLLYLLFERLWNNYAICVKLCKIYITARNETFYNLKVLKMGTFKFTIQER